MGDINFDNNDDHLNEKNADHDLFADESHGADDVAATKKTASPRRSRRALIIGAIVLIVVIISFSLFSLRPKKSSNPRQKLFSTSPIIHVEQLSLKDADSPSTKKPAKRRKIVYKKLFETTIDQAPDILRELSLANIAFDTEQKGKAYTIKVDEQRADDAKNLLALKGLPAGGAKGYQLLDNAQTLGVTEFDKRIRFLRALSGELEKAIAQFDMIENCKVQIVLPEQRLFAVTQPPVTASILIRKIPGKKISDDVVFSIIELVSNAVENLQPENVSVIDTEGIVLSAGIFERMAARERQKEQKAAKQTAAENAAGVIPTGPVPIAQKLPKIGQPIIPDFNRIKNWYEIKREYEKTLEEKATRQLVGILPVGSFKVAITSDIGPLENGKIVDIKRISASIVVDNSREDLDVDDNTKTQIYNTVSATIGYVKGRDNILLTRANFNLYSEPQQKTLEKNTAPKFKFPKYVTKWGLSLIGTLLGFFLILKVLQFFKKHGKNKQQVSNMIKQTDKRETDFSTIQVEINTDKKLEKIKQTASLNPQILAAIMEEWLETEKTKVF